MPLDFHCISTSECSSDKVRQRYSVYFPTPSHSSIVVYVTDLYLEIYIQTL